MFVYYRILKLTNCHKFVEFSKVQHREKQGYYQPLEKWWIAMFESCRVELQVLSPVMNLWSSIRRDKNQPEWKFNWAVFIYQWSNFTRGSTKFWESFLGLAIEKNVIRSSPGDIHVDRHFRYISSPSPLLLGQGGQFFMVNSVRAPHNLHFQVLVIRALQTINIYLVIAQWQEMTNFRRTSHLPKSSHKYLFAN